VTITDSVIVKECPHCNKFIGVFNQSSGNTFGGVHWTDGKSYFPMLDQYNSLVKTHCCGNLIWLDKLDVIDKIKLYPRNESEVESKKNLFEKLLSYEYPEFNDYIQLINELSITQDEERNYRLLAWWAGNDIRREYHYKKRRINEDKYYEMSVSEKNNIKILFNLLNDKVQNEIIAKAEIKRELGEYEQAINLLTYVTDYELKIYSEMILKLCLQKDFSLREVII
jgi:hypothetical protein